MPIHDKEWHCLKETLAAAPVLAFYDPRSNGPAEKGVQIVKRILKKAVGANESFFLGLLNYRPSPLEDGRSPSEILMGRRIRSRLPDFTSDDAVHVWKRKQNIHRDSLLPPLSLADTVRLQRSGSWDVKARVQDQLAPRSYRVLTEDGREVRQNRQHLLRTPEVFTLPTVAPDYSTANKTTEAATPQAEPGPTSKGPAEDNSQVPPVQEPQLRRSSRQRRPPDRLMYN
ncbi:uncharacterized protein LOC135370436 [Ornithodoros turicata]|uniref:uncharacterized protein LOC135370436 n=1 Tax=Ornithodoros turicata TaxID=34597 RepID=UPI003139D741